MAEETWNKVNIPVPSTRSTVRIPFTISKGTVVKRVLVENDNVLKLLGSNVLQTEIRILYDLLFVLNNSFRQQKPFRALKQVEQCINRLKEMKLDAALLDLKELCPTEVQRQLAEETGQCDVPSQPMLEWLCLKLLGAARLMTCLLNRCTRAFILARKHLQSKEFILLNMVITSMLSRLWVFFQGIRAFLPPLYHNVLKILKDVSQDHAMPYLQDVVLPEDLSELLGPSQSLLKIQPHPSVKGIMGQRPSGSLVLQRLFGQEGERSSKVAQHSTRKSEMVDLGTAVSLQRPGVPGKASGFDLKSLLKKKNVHVTEVSTEKVQHSSAKPDASGQKKSFLTQLKSATSFSDMAVRLEEVVQWCQCRKLWLEKGRLKLLYLKCQRMKHLELDGCRMQGKLRRYKREVCWALSLRGDMPKTCQSLKTLWRRAHLRVPFEPIRTAVGVNRKQSPKPKFSVLQYPFRGVATMTDLSLSNKHGNGSRDLANTVKKISDINESDIDDIFASKCF
ncbi:hypothetical protein UPYG_G00158140 [Umbra pygmaea]|uniref:Nucleolus and neural progenitor protein-like N-terminal domain-containing protein n=1 Tax=Umbra pygmaea TaxID=75934 RepID=A0ABD0WYP8_UMBPY